MKNRVRSTSESVFDTFPWPQFELGSAPAPGAADGALAVGTWTPSQQTALPQDDRLAAPKGCREGAETDTRGACAPRSQQCISQITAVAEAAREVRCVRAEALAKLKGGLRALYRTLELPGANPLKDAHAALDAAVIAAYGFNPNADLLAQLLALNLETAAKIEKGEPVTAPGVPPGFPEPKELVTEDCIRPPAPS